MKKRVMCVRWMNTSITNSAISELILLSKGARRPPNGYMLVGYVCFSVFTTILSLSYTVLSKFC